MNVYVPIAGPAQEVILRGSGIVGTEVPTLPPQVVIDYEGNAYGAVNLRTWADRVARAADRHETRYPTVARMTVRVEQLLWVGVYENGQVTLHDKNAEWAVANWLGLGDELPADELQVNR
jgi:hypothetical protein